MNTLAGVESQYETRDFISEASVSSPKINRLNEELEKRWRIKSTSRSIRMALMLSACQNNNLELFRSIFEDDLGTSPYGFRKKT